MTDRSPTVDRRELIRRTLGGIAFGALAVGATVLTWSKGRDDCRLTLPCGSCDRRDDCDLDRRREARRTER